MQSIKGEKSALGAEGREGEMEEEEHAVHQFQVAAGEAMNFIKKKKKRYNQSAPVSQLGHHHQIWSTCILLKIISNESTELKERATFTPEIWQEN